MKDLHTDALSPSFRPAQTSVSVKANAPKESEVPSLEKPQAEDELILIGLGEVLWDILPHASGRGFCKKLGGAPANFAFHVSQLGFHSIVVSAIGIDTLGKKTLEALNEKQLDHHLATVPFPTGTVEVTLDPQGVPTYKINEHVAWDNLPFTNSLRALAGKCRAVCFGSLAQRSQVTRTSIRQFLEATPKECLKVFDINLRQNFYTKQVIQDSLEMCNFFKINNEELAILRNLFACGDMEIDEFLQLLLRDFRLDLLILTCGTAGSYIFSPYEHSFLPTPKVPVVDTVGAGDAFTAAFVCAFLKGSSIIEAHQKAVEVSAFVCTQAGAMPEHNPSAKRKKLVE